MRRALCLALALAIVASCKSKASDSQPAPTQPGHSVTPVVPASTPDAQALDAASAEAPSIAAPPIDLAPVSLRARRDARAGHTSARELHKERRYDRAIAAYVEALTKNPGHLYARYNLASALAASNRPDDALRILAEFSIADCQFCLSRLVRARTDGEWQSLWDDLRFRALTGDVALAATPPRAIVEAFMAALDSGEAARVARFIHPNEQLKIVSTTYLGLEDTHIERTSLWGPDELRDWLGKSGFVSPVRDEESPIDQGVWVVGAIDECEGPCCRVEVECEDRCGAGHDGLITSLDRVCTAADSGAARYLRTVEITATD